MIKTGQITIEEPTQLFPHLPISGSVRLTISNLGPDDAYISHSSGVSVNNGYILSTGDEPVILEIDDLSKLYATSDGSVTATWLINW